MMMVIMVLIIIIRFSANCTALTLRLRACQHGKIYVEGVTYQMYRVKIMFEHL